MCRLNRLGDWKRAGVFETGLLHFFFVLPDRHLCDDLHLNDE
jgi:hypothetical protein